MQKIKKKLDDSENREKQLINQLDETKNTLKNIMTSIEVLFQNQSSPVSSPANQNNRTRETIYPSRNVNNLTIDSTNRLDNDNNQRRDTRLSQNNNRQISQITNQEQSQGTVNRQTREETIHNNPNNNENRLIQMNENQKIQRNNLSQLNIRIDNNDEQDNNENEIMDQQIRQSNLQLRNNAFQRLSLRNQGQEKNFPEIMNQNLENFLKECFLQRVNINQTNCFGPIDRRKKNKAVTVLNEAVSELLDDEFRILTTFHDPETQQEEYTNWHRSVIRITKSVANRLFEKYDDAGQETRRGGRKRKRSKLPSNVGVIYRRISAKNSDRHY